MGEFADRQRRAADPTRPRCKVDGCTDAGIIGGFCDPHYWEARSANALECEEPGCEQKSDVRGRCRPHYKKMMTRTRGKPGTLYVIEASTGVVRVGRTTLGTTRIQQHRNNARTWGADILRWWMTPEVPNAAQSEKQLLSFIDGLGVTSHTQEAFEGLDYDLVVKYIEEEILVP